MLEAEELFRILWSELDFDDHPLNGGHGLDPEGELHVESESGLLSLIDKRIHFQLYSDTQKLSDGWKNGMELRDSQHRPISIHLLSENPMLARAPPGRLGLHRWSVHRSMLTSQLWEWIIQKTGELNTTEISDVGNICLFPELSSHEGTRFERNVEEWRDSLHKTRNGLMQSASKALQGWTWHLEIDNKADRLGWYIRCPNEWNSLFTIFAGFCWNPISPESMHGMLLFERAPEGELDRDDEAESNLMDVERTEILCAPDGPIAELSANPSWNDSADPINLGGGVHLWPTSMGRWPLIHAISAVKSDDEIHVWLNDKIGLISPVIRKLRTL